MNQSIKTKSTSVLLGLAVLVSLSGCRLFDDPLSGVNGGISPGGGAQIADGGIGDAGQTDAGDRNAHTTAIDAGRDAGNTSVVVVTPEPVYEFDRAMAVNSGLANDVRNPNVVFDLSAATTGGYVQNNFATFGSFIGFKFRTTSRETISLALASLDNQGEYRLILLPDLNERPNPSHDEIIRGTRSSDGKSVSLNAELEANKGYIYMAYRTASGSTSGSFGIWSTRTPHVVTPPPARCSSNNGPVSIAIIGDSITQRYESSPTWRRTMYQTLRAENHNVDFVGSWKKQYCGAWYDVQYCDPQYNDFDQDHEGHYGWRADQIADALPGWLNGYTPDVALIHLGTNDVFQNQSTDSTLEDLRRIVSTLRGDCGRVTILLSKIIPTAETHENRSARIDELNARIPALVADLNNENSRVLLVDQTVSFDAQSMTGDGIHPTVEHEHRLSDRYLEALRPVLNTLR